MTESSVDCYFTPACDCSLHRFTRTATREELVDAVWDLSEDLGTEQQATGDLLEENESLRKSLFTASVLLRAWNTHGG